MENNKLTYYAKPLFVGISAVKNGDGTIVLSIATHDHTYLLDYMVEHLKIDPAQKGKDIIADYVISQIQKYEHENFVKFVGASRKVVCILRDDIL